MKLRIRPALQRGRVLAFPVVWLTILGAGIGLREPVVMIDAASFLAFNIGAAVGQERSGFAGLAANTGALTFVRNDTTQPDEARPFGTRSDQAGAGGHGRFAAPANAIRRVQSRAINPRTADELAGFFRDVSYTLTDIRQGETVPAIKLERVPDDLGTKDGPERKVLFITALLPIILEVNQRVMVEREQLITLRDKQAVGRPLAPVERVWVQQLAARYEVPFDRIDELVRRVDIVPPSMALAQGGVESGWGTSYAARQGNALFGQIQTGGRHAVVVPWRVGIGMPQPFSSVGEAAEAYITNLTTHPAYAGFRADRAAMRSRGETPDGYQLIGNLLRYSELGHKYVRFVRAIISENRLGDFDNARLSGF